MNIYFLFFPKIKLQLVILATSSIMRLWAGQSNQFLYN